MTDSTKPTLHTPGPLKVSFVNETAILDAHGMDVASTDFNYEDDFMECAANAERIVLAWNCYDDLLEALEEAHLELIAEWGAEYFDDGDGKRNAAIIARAKGETP